MKKTPLLILIISLCVLFTVLSLAGQGSIYAGEEKDLLKKPLLADVFTAMQKGTYPWALFDGEARAEAKAEAEERLKMEEELKKKAEEASESTPSPTAVPTLAPAKPLGTPEPTATPEPTPMFPEGRLEPLRESTYDEYLSHISADIYGDLGVQRAASYEFTQVPVSYFDDALFIGDSRVVGLGKYTELSEHADFLCETSLTAAKVFESNFRGKGTVENYLRQNDYGKIYLMVGINELGTGTTEFFMEQYTAVVDRLHELEPDALIFIQAIMNVDAEKNDSDKIFNNQNILGRNHAIATLADNDTFFYIDVNEVVCDENGNLDEELTFDHLHLIGAANEIWEKFLCDHAVVKEGMGPYPTPTPESTEPSPSPEKEGDTDAGSSGDSSTENGN